MRMKPKSEGLDVGRGGFQGFRRVLHGHALPRFLFVDMGRAAEAPRRGVWPVRRGPRQLSASPRFLVDNSTGAFSFFFYFYRPFFMTLTSKVFFL